MRVLILGGTQFIGRHIVDALLAGGHSVSVLTRGKTPDALPPQVERLCGDRDAADAGLAALGGRTWDACVDVSGYTPRQVRPSAEALSGIVSRYVFISTGSVYGDAKKRPVTEDNATMTPAAADVTVIDGRDLARFARKVIEGAIAGTFSMAGHRVTWKEFMTILGAKNPVWVPKELLEGVDSTELPLYRPEHGTYAGLMDVSNAKAVAAGLRLRELAVTVKDTRDWLETADLPLSLTPEREAELIAKARR